MQIALRGEKYIAELKQAAGRAVLRDRVERLTRLGESLHELLAFESATTAGPDLQRPLLVLELLGAANACDSDMSLPAAQGFVRARRGRRGRVSRAALSHEDLKRVDDVNAEILDGLDRLCKALQKP